MKTKILVVDDDVEILEIMRGFLGGEGFDVTVAQNSDGFRREAFRAKPDLIILDIMLGNANGPLVHEGLLRDGFDPGIPVLFLSGLAEDRDLSPAAEGRKYALYGKPFHRDELLKGIRSLIKVNGK